MYRGQDAAQQPCVHVCCAPHSSRVCMYACVCIGISIGMCMCVCACVCVCVSVCVCVRVGESGGVAGLCERDFRRRFAVWSTGPIHTPMSIRPAGHSALRMPSPATISPSPLNRDDGLRCVRSACAPHEAQRMRRLSLRVFMPLEMPELPMPERRSAHG